VNEIAPILDVRGVPGGTAERVSFALAPGQWAWWPAADADAMTRIADGLCGLAASPVGEVRFNGRSWADAGPAEQALMRSKIGRVFAATAWVANLDVDENIVLAGLYHGDRSLEELLAEATCWARRFGLSELPAGRPARVSTRDLQRCQWIRALLNRPRLLLLEAPEQAAGDAASAFREAVAETLTGGAAAVWLTSGGGPPPPGLPSPTWAGPTPGMEVNP